LLDHRSRLTDIDKKDPLGTATVPDSTAQSAGLAPATMFCTAWLEHQINVLVRLSVQPFAKID
jgi:hypothetical protein